MEGDTPVEGSRTARLEAQLVITWLLFAFLALMMVPSALAWPGRLLDPQGRSVVGARVTPAGEAGGVITGTDGRFDLPGDRPPRVLIVELPDGTSLVVDLRASSPSKRVPATDEDSFAEIIVRVDPALSEQVHTTVPVAAELLALPASQAFSVSREQIRQLGATALQQALAQLPGSEPASPDPDRVPVFRGLGDSRTLFLLDRASVGSERRAGVSGGGMHPATWGGVEVIRGPGALVYGSGAMGGVLLVESRWAPIGVERGTEWSFEARGGGSPGWSASAAYQTDGWSAAIGRRRSKDQQSAAGVAIRGEYTQSSLFVGRSWFSRGQLFRLGFRGDRLEDAFRPRIASSRKQTVVPRDEQLRAVLQIDRPGSVERKFVAWWGMGSRLITQLRPVPVPTRSTDTTQREAGARLSWRGRREGLAWTLGTEIRLRYGIEASLSTRLIPAPLGERRVDRVLERDSAGLFSSPSFVRRGEEARLLLSDNEGSSLRSGQLLSLALFALGKRGLAPWLDLAVGARIEPSWMRARGIEAGDGEATFAWAASGALIARTVRQGKFTLQLARSFRVPSMTDRYLAGITGRGFKEASPGLDAERGLHLDLGWHLETGRFQCGAGVFHYRIADILVREYSQLERYRFVNRAQATIRGVETSVTMNLRGSWSLYAGLHHLRGEGRDGAWLAAIPSDGASLSLRKGFARGAYLRGELVAVSHDRRAGPGEEPVAGFAVVNLGAAFPLTQHVRLRVGLHNTFDRRYRVSSRKNNPEAPGRTFILGLALLRAR